MIRHIIYRLIGRNIDLKKNFLEQPLEQAGMQTTPGWFVSTGALIAIPVVLVTLLLYLLFRNGLLFLIIPSYVLLFFYYPFWKISNRASEIDKELPHALNYISIKVAVGVNISEVFYSISIEPSFCEIRKEFFDIYREIEFLGADLSTALLRASMRTPSKNLASTFNNIISMIAAGSDMSIVLRNTAEMHMQEHYRRLNRAVDNLSLFAEMYIILAVTVPIIFMISFPVVEVISSFFSGTLGTTPVQFMNKSTAEAVIYLIIPSVSAVSVIILDVIIPEDMKL